MKFPICILSLGYTRIAGVTLYDTKTRDFTETTPRNAKELISMDMVKGLQWNGEEFVPDKRFNMQNILIKTAVGKYRPMYNDLPGLPVYSRYVLVRVLETNKGRLFELVNNKCQRVKLTEKQLRELYAIDAVAGVFIGEVDENYTYTPIGYGGSAEGEITICEGVVVENRVYPEHIDFGEVPLRLENSDQYIGKVNDNKNEEAEEKVEPAEETVEESVEVEKIEEQEEPTSAESVDIGSGENSTVDGDVTGDGGKNLTVEPVEPAEKKVAETLEEAFGAVENTEPAEETMKDVFESLEGEFKLPEKEETKSSSKSRKQSNKKK